MTGSVIELLEGALATLRRASAFPDSILRMGYMSKVDGDILIAQSKLADMHAIGPDNYSDQNIHAQFLGLMNELTLMEKCAHGTAQYKSHLDNALYRLGVLAHELQSYDLVPFPRWSEP